MEHDFYYLFSIYRNRGRKSHVLIEGNGSLFTSKNDFLQVRFALMTFSEDMNLVIYTLLYRYFTIWIIRASHN